MVGLGRFDGFFADGAVHFFLEEDLAEGLGSGLAGAAGLGVSVVAGVVGLESGDLVSVEAGVAGAESDLASDL